MSAPQPPLSAQEVKLQQVMTKALSVEAMPLLQSLTTMVSEMSGSSADTQAQILLAIATIEARLMTLEDLLQEKGAPAVRAARPVAGGAGAGAGAKAVAAPKTKAARSRAAAAVGVKVPTNTMIWYELMMSTDPAFQEMAMQDDTKATIISNSESLHKFYDGEVVPPEKISAYWKAVGKLLWQSFGTKEKEQLKHQFDIWKKTQEARLEAPPLGEDDDNVGEDGTLAAEGEDGEGAEGAAGFVF